MGLVMQELVYSLNYVLEHTDLMWNWVHIEVEKVSVRMCNLCGEYCESVKTLFMEFPCLFRAPYIIYRALKKCRERI